MTRRQGDVAGPLRLRATRRAVAAALVIAVAFAAAIIIGRAGGGRHNAAPPASAFPPSSLAPDRGALFGAWVQPTGYSGVGAEQAAVAAFEHTIGRPLAITATYVSWTAPMPIAFAQWALQRDSIPMITWAGAPTNRIAAGGDDALIRSRALQLKGLHGPVMLRWFAEMDLGENRADAISPASYVAAWRHMHDIFSSVGATNVRWVWCPNGSAFAAGIAQAYYPGNAYVDWIGADGYNWAPELARAPWRSFEQIFLPFYQWGLSTSKPMLVGEFGTVEGAPGGKAAWFTQADRALRTQFPAIRAVVYFESRHQNFGQYFDWRVTTSRSSLAAFRAFAHDPYFGARSPGTRTAGSPSGLTGDNTP